MSLLELKPQGLYCVAGDFYIDPQQPVARAVITHAHSDHARPGHGSYLAAAPSIPLLRVRLRDISLQSLPYGESIVHHGVRLSLHPAGHILGASQVRLESGGETWVVSGDYKRVPDPTCALFEPQRCNVFVTESTFALPLYRWDDAPLDDILAWWRANAAQGKTSVLFAYALGKAQRIMAGLAARGAPGAFICHGAVDALNAIYRDSGIPLPPTLTADAAASGDKLNTALVLAPPSAQGTPWLRRFGNYSDGWASGWMRLRGARRRRAVDRGFALSDHVDWPGLLQTVRETGASRVIAQHGYAAVLARYLREQGLDAIAWDTHTDEREESAKTHDQTMGEGTGSKAGLDADMSDMDA